LHRGGIVRQLFRQKLQGNAAAQLQIFRCGTQKFNPSGIDDGEVGFSVRFDLLQWIRSIGGF
jgi:hypothetical protein